MGSASTHGGGIDQRTLTVQIKLACNLQLDFQNLKGDLKMPCKPLKTTAILLFAIASSGCVSQNAMTTLPDDVRMTVLADQVRAAQGEEVENAASADSASAGKPEPNALSQEELLFRSRQKHADRFAPAPASANPEKQGAVKHAGSDTVDPRQLFARAMELRSSAPIKSPEQSSKTENNSSIAVVENSAPAANEVWQQVLAMRKENSNSTATGKDDLSKPVVRVNDDPIITAAVSRQEEVIDVPAPDDLFEFALRAEDKNHVAGDKLLDEETHMQLALRRKGGRIPRQITIGKIKGEGYEVLKAARERADQVINITGGEPAFGYDPSLTGGKVRIEYMARRQGRQNS